MIAIASLQHNDIRTKMAADLQGEVVALTGADGDLASSLGPRLAARGVFIVAITMTDVAVPFASEHRIADLRDAASARAALAGCAQVIHLAALSSTSSTYEDILANNMVMDKNILDAAVACGARRVVYASSNHVHHGASMRTTPETLDSTVWGMHIVDDAGVRHGRLHRLEDQPFPDSFYAMSKLHGENLGKLCARQHGLDFVALRIGWIVREANVVESRANVPSCREYMRAMYLSHSDCEEIFHRALVVELPASSGVGTAGGHYAVAFAVSNNARRVLDTRSSEALLGYTAADDIDRIVGALPDWN